eukprot:gene9768-3321_t
MHSIERRNRKSVKVQMEYAEEVGGDFRNHITRLHVRVTADGELAKTTGGSTLSNRGIVLYCPRCRDLEKKRLRCRILVSKKTADEQEAKFAMREPYTFMVPAYFGTMFGAGNGSRGQTEVQLCAAGGRGAALRNPALLFEFLHDLAHLDVPEGVMERRYRVTQNCMKFKRKLLLAVARDMEHIQVTQFRRALGAPEAGKEAGFAHIEMDG